MFKYLGQDKSCSLRIFSPGDVARSIGDAGLTLTRVNTATRTTKKAAARRRPFMRFNSNQLILYRRRNDHTLFYVTFLREQYNSYLYIMINVYNNNI